MMPCARTWRRLAAACLLALAVGGCGGPAAPARLPGDPRAGLAIYKYAGCAACHALSGVSVGSASAGAPALDGEGGRHDLRWLQTMLAAHVRREHLAPLSPGEVRDLASYLATLR
jgi:mono/diheme cytochrome c family protein